MNKNEIRLTIKDEMKNRISLALKDPILQQGFEIICKENAELKHQLEHRNCLDCSNHSSNLRMRNLDLEKENAELRKIAEFQQSSNMNTHFENKKLKEGLAVGSTWNKHLNSLNKALEEDRDKYREMTFDMKAQLTTAKELLKWWVSHCGNHDLHYAKKTEQFLNSEGCPDCLCKDCSKDCGIKKLGLVEVEK